MWRPRGQNFADLGNSFITPSLISEMTSYSWAAEPALTAQSWISCSQSQFLASRSSLFVVGGTVLENLKTDPRTRAIRVTDPGSVAAVKANHAKHKMRGEGFLPCTRSFHPPTHMKMHLNNTDTVCQTEHMTFGAGKNHSLPQATQRHHCAVDCGTQVIGTDFESS